MRPARKPTGYLARSGQGSHFIPSEGTDPFLETVNISIAQGRGADRHGPATRRGTVDLLENHAPARVCGIEEGALRAARDGATDAHESDCRVFAFREVTKPVCAVAAA